MKVKKYIASTMPEAMGRIRQEMGDEAVILKSREIAKGGFLGLFTKKYIEVIAAVDQSEQNVIRNPKPFETESEERSLLSEMKQLKEEIKQLSRPKEKQHALFDEINELLMSQEIRKPLIQQINNDLKERYEKQQLKSIPFETQKEWAMEWLTKMLNEKEIAGFQYEKRLLNIVGPTGVGKTTTIAKIAAKAVLKDNKKVAFITTDTYRIAAIEQLKTYATLLNVPVEVVYNEDDFAEAAKKFSSYDLVLVDTAGRNFREHKFVKQLDKTIDFNQDMETYLVLSLTSKYEDMKAIVHQFNQLPIEKIIFTKKDETSSFGAMLNVLYEFPLGIAYITDGQNVPEDIIVPSIDYILHCIFGGQEDEN
ncbi:flagellar biosynthesis protein FlhF [Pueribacillus theae]|uniref:Flagellar biosynthesis protein FlhF n=1 Tax=Pueribacillus theae TaxID=2171751 RepID=A0A2U1K7K7_9BACI|nr:flagellar biosynthesis protein FlhF [Pueribacillus theae]PWA13521.1 flagellar biosynthesis protein FlhF [Pueribacillus theae]